MSNLGSDYVSLGAALKALRRTAALTQVEAAELIGIRSTFVSQVERGERGCRWHTLLKFLKAYGVDLATLAVEISRVEEAPGTQKAP
jgi:transcriptional regulator with XRE-family HTH domain